MRPARIDQIRSSCLVKKRMAAAAIFDFTLRFNVAAEVQPARGAAQTYGPLFFRQHAAFNAVFAAFAAFFSLQCELAARTWTGWTVVTMSG